MNIAKKGMSQFLGPEYDEMTAGAPGEAGAGAPEEAEEPGGGEIPEGMGEESGMGSSALGQSAPGQSPPGQPPSDPMLAAKEQFSALISQLQGLSESYPGMIDQEIQVANQALMAAMVKVVKMTQPDPISPMIGI